MSNVDIYKFVLDYEIRSSRFSGFMFGNFLQGLAARYFARKVSSKMGRYIANKERSAQLLEEAAK